MRDVRHEPGDPCGAPRQGAASGGLLVDRFGRRIDYLRVSVTDRCNLRCRYCMPEEGIPLLHHDEVLRAHERQAVLAAAVTAGIRGIRLTGGEPLVKRGIVDQVAKIAALDGLEELALTTNGVLLAPLAVPLRQAGLQRVNLGLPSLDPAIHARLTRSEPGTLRQALDGIEAALAAGLAPVKINVVVMRGVNDDPTPFIELARRLPLQVRFIEYMPIGPADSTQYFVPAREIAARLATVAGGPLPETGRQGPGRGPADRLLHLPGAPGKLAVLAPISEHFCDRCNRLRLASDGKLRLCLFADEEIDLLPALRPTVRPDELGRLFRRAVQQKPQQIPDLPGRGSRGMGQIGG